LNHEYDFVKTNSWQGKNSRSFYVVQHEKSCCMVMMNEPFTERAALFFGKASKLGTSILGNV